MRVLITGATGFIGRSLVPYLAAQTDTAVTILVRETYSQADVKPLPPPLANVRPQVYVVYADLRNFRLTTRAISQAQPDCIIHLAAAGVTDPFLSPETALRHNLAGTLNLLRACFQKTSTTRQVIVARTPGERSAMNVYAASKAAAWTFCRMYARTQQWPIYGATIFQAYGPGQATDALIPAALTAALAGQDFPMTAGRQARDWIYIDDVVAGLAALLGRHLAPGTAVDLGTGQATPVAEVVGQIYALVDGGGQPRPGMLPERPGEEPHQVADAARTRALIGWQAAVSLPEGLARLVNQSRRPSRNP